MLEVLFITPQPARLADLASALVRREGLALRWAGTGREAMAAAADRPPSLAVLDEDLGQDNPWELLVELAQIDAFVNTAVVSGLPEDDFRRASEGLGVLAQLPPRPGGMDAAVLLQRLDKMIGPAARPRPTGRPGA